MSKSRKEKKLILGSALAGLILVGPGLSVTATPTAKFFQTAQLNVGYRQAQAADTAPVAVDKKEVKAEKKAEPTHECKDDKCCGGAECKDKHCDKDAKRCDEKKDGKECKDKCCGKDGKCSPEKACGKEKTPAPKADAPKSDL